jgi:hypothetical protein
VLNSYAIATVLIAEGTMFTEPLSTKASIFWPYYSGFQAFGGSINT